MDDDLKDGEIFLTGENHGIKANIELRTKFLKYYKERTNFKYYLCELPYSMTYFLNIYLETKDENILKDIYRPLKGTEIKSLISVSIKESTKQITSNK